MYGSDRRVGCAGKSESHRLGTVLHSSSAASCWASARAGSRPSSRGARLAALAGPARSRAACRSSWQAGPGAWLGGLVAAVCLGVMAGGLVSTGAALPFVGCGGDDSGTAVRAPVGRAAPERQRRHRLPLRRAGRPRQPRGRRGTSSGQSADGEAPAIERIRRQRLGIEAASSGGLFGFSGRREQLDRHAADRSVDRPRRDAQRGRLAGSTLAGAHLAAIDLTVNAGSLRLDLRDVAAATSARRNCQCRIEPLSGCPNCHSRAISR